MQGLGLSLDTAPPRSPPRKGADRDEEEETLQTAAKRYKLSPPDSPSSEEGRDISSDSEVDTLDSKAAQKGSPLQHPVDAGKLAQHLSGLTPVPMSTPTADVEA